MQFYAEMQKYVIFEFDFAWVPQRIYNYLILHCKGKRPKFNNNDILILKINILTFSSRLNSKLGSRKQKTADLSAEYMLFCKVQSIMGQPWKFRTDCMIGTHAKLDFNLPTDEQHVSVSLRIIA